METLADIQRRFATALLDETTAPTGLFRSPDHADECFALYRGNLLAHWETALRAAYPVLQRMVGNAFFRTLARDYGHQHPSHCGDLNRFGASLDVFLSDFQPAEAYPWFADMARLEWALHCAHYAANEETLKPDDLHRLDPADADVLGVRLAGSARCLESTWSIHSMWVAHQQVNVVMPEPLDVPESVVVCRPAWRAQAMLLETGEPAAINLLADGTSLGAALGAYAASSPAPDPGAALSRWLRWGLLCRA